MNDTFKYFAFISSSSHDKHWGMRLHRRLEHYRISSTLCSQLGWERTPMRPIFFAPTDIQPGPLSDELKKRLKESRHLIVICSPNSAQSEWVSKEIEYFHSLGRISNIHFFIVKGTPHSNDPAEKCFNPIITKLGLPEILASNIHEKVYVWPWLNKERAYIQLISKLLGVEFDSIWQRHKRLLTRNVTIMVIGCIAITAAMIGVWYTSQPFDITLKLTEASIHNDNLPSLKNAVVAMRLDNETKTDTIYSFDDSIVFTNIPHKYLNQETRISISSPGFLQMDSILPLSKSMTLNLYRDDSFYGSVKFRLYNPNTEQYLSNVRVGIAGQETYTDSKGCVTFSVPLKDQRTYYLVTSPISLENNTIFVPCDDKSTIMTK